MGIYNIELAGITVLKSGPIALKAWEDGHITDSPLLGSQGYPVYRYIVMNKPDDDAEYSDINVDVESKNIPPAIPDFTPVKIENATLRVSTWTDPRGKTRVSEKVFAKSVKKI